MLCGNSAYASDSMKQFNTDKLEESISNFISTHNVQGTLAASRDGRIFYLKAQGECSSQKVCDTNTQYAVGSVTKQFTAAALLRVLFDNVCERNVELLQQELHKPVINFLNNKDEIWLEGKAPEWSKSVTLHHLLSQTSGLPDVTAEEYEEFNKVPHSRQEVIALYTKDKALNFEPGHEYGYSAANYFIAGVIVEKISGKSLGSYLHETFFEPANMRSTFLPENGTIQTLKESQAYPKLAEGYVYSLKDTSAYPMIDYYRAENNQGEGGMISCVEDLIAWNKAFYTTELILPDAVKNLMLAPTVLSEGQISNYAYGVEVDNTDGAVYFHDGLVPGFQSKLVYDSKNNVTFVQLSNISYDLLQFVDYMTRYQAIESSDTSKIEKEEQIRLLNAEYPEAENQVNKHSLIDYGSIRESLPDFSALLSLNMHQEKLTWSWTKKLIEENESLKFAASYNEAHPEAEAAGYGPFALVPYNDEVVSLGYQTNVWDF